MKVTPEMVEAGACELTAGVPQAGHLRRARMVLEAALADVPEPSATNNRLRAQRDVALDELKAAEAKLAQTEALVAAQEQRAKWAEAKLAKVRTCAQIHGSSDCGEEILAILDGEE